MDSQNQQGSQLRLSRWQLIIAALALACSLLFSGIALWKGCQNENYLSAANVQIVSSEGNRSINLNDSEDADTLCISGTVELKNYGRAAVQIVKVEWEPLISSGNNSVEGMWLAFYDHLDTSLGGDVHGFYVNRDNPVLSLHETIILPGQKRTFSVAFFGQGQLEPMGDPNVCVSLTFSNGQGVSFLPDINWSVIAG